MICEHLIRHSLDKSFLSKSWEDDGNIKKRSLDIFLSPKKCKFSGKYANFYKSYFSSVFEDYYIIPHGIYWMCD